ncbi:hypothetical protein AMTR_s00070p00174770 [Amborella trichopoda]|uniref:poly(A)-specific ribonuclease n=1 Tax=Amborella trichopoda TaxID=13333 RepID=U5DDN1_AMBTC|nr:hypothetical protein AMTR_s00070p00174770 [Amborella trichopoda]
MADVLIIDVWADNVHEEFSRIRDVVHRYPYIAFDTEFSGFVNPSDSRAGARIYNGHIKANVVSLKLIQVGLTFFDEFGNSGIDFEKNHTKGVTSQTLADSLTFARLVSNPAVHWVTFHGTYDMSYLAKPLNGCTLLPDPLSTFLSMVNRIFPNFYDAKHMVHHHYIWTGGLSKLARDMGVQSSALDMHQAGADSVVTVKAFVILKKRVIKRVCVGECNRLLYGL